MSETSGAPDAAVQRPRLLVMASTYPRWQGDPEPGFVHELAQRLATRFAVTVLAPHAPAAAAEEVLDGVRVIRYRYAPSRFETLVNDGGIVLNLRQSKWKWLLVPLFFAAQFLMAWRIIRRWRPDVIHAHWLIPQGVTAAALRTIESRTPPFIVTSHGADLYALNGKYLKAIKRWVLRRASAATVVSSAMVAELRQLGVPSSKFGVVPMGADFAQRFTPDGETVRKRCELLFVGRLVPKKGLQILAEALPLICARFPDVTLTVAGFGPENGRLQQQVQALQLANRVNFLGAIPQTELPALYRRAAVFVAPFVRDSSGDQEGLPVALMEAIACGCPVVVGDVAGIDDLLPNDQQCRIVPGNVQALAEAVIRVLEQPTLARKRAAEIRQQLLDRIDWGIVAARYAQLLDSQIQ